MISKGFNIFRSKHDELVIAKNKQFLDNIN
jgi:hypothetical protein